MSGSEDFISIGICSLALEKALGFDLYKLEEDDFRLYRHRSIPFQQTDIDKLLEDGWETLYVPKNQRSALYEHMSAHLTQTLTDPCIPVEEKMSALTETSTKILAAAVTSPNSAREIKAIYKQTENHVIFALLGGESQKEMQTTKAQAPHALAHALTVCNLSILLGIRCGIVNQQELRDLGAGALLHEVGKSLLDDRYYFRVGAGPQITDSRLRNYPSIGKKLLERTNALNKLALQLVLEHQERLDGTGFPNNLTSKDLSLHSRIVAICDYFDEQTNPSTSNIPESPFCALKSMRAESAKFDGTALCQFIHMLGGNDNQPAGQKTSKSASSKTPASNAGA